jgi:hypothetical protein
MGELFNRMAILYSRHFSILAASAGVCCAGTAIAGATIGSLETISFSLAGGLAAMIAAFQTSGEDLPD